MAPPTRSESGPRRSPRTRDAGNAPKANTVKTVSSENRPASASARKTRSVKTPPVQNRGKVGSTAASQKQSAGMTTTESDGTNTSNHDRATDNRDSAIVQRPDKSGKKQKKKRRTGQKPPRARLLEKTTRQESDADPDDPNYTDDGEEGTPDECNLSLSKNCKPKGKRTSAPSTPTTKPSKPTSRSPYLYQESSPSPMKKKLKASNTPEPKVPKSITNGLCKHHSTDSRTSGGHDPIYSFDLALAPKPSNLHLNDPNRMGAIAGMTFKGIQENITGYKKKTRHKSLLGYPMNLHESSLVNKGERAHFNLVHHVHGYYCIPPVFDSVAFLKRSCLWTQFFCCF